MLQVETTFWESNFNIQRHEIDVITFLPSRPRMMPLPLLLDPPRPRMASLSPFFSLISEGPPSFPRLRFFPTVSQEFWWKVTKVTHSLTHTQGIVWPCVRWTHCVRGAFQQEIDGSVYIFVTVVQGYHAFILTFPSHFNQLQKCKTNTNC